MATGERAKEKRYASLPKRAVPLHLHLHRKADKYEHLYPNRVAHIRHLSKEKGTSRLEQKAHAGNQTSSQTSLLDGTSSSPCLYRKELCLRRRSMSLIVGPSAEIFNNFNSVPLYRTEPGTLATQMNSLIHTRQLATPSTKPMFDSLLRFSSLFPLAQSLSSLASLPSKGPLS